MWQFANPLEGPIGDTAEFSIMFRTRMAAHSTTPAGNAFRSLVSVKHARVMDPFQGWSWRYHPLSYSSRNELFQTSLERLQPAPVIHGPK